MLQYARARDMLLTFSPKKQRLVAELQRCLSLLPFPFPFPGTAAVASPALLTSAEAATTGSNGLLLQGLGSRQQRNPHIPLLLTTVRITTIVWAILSTYY